jgi:aminotransferase
VGGDDMKNAMKVASRMNSIPFSGIRKMFEEVTQREKRGEKIIHLEMGRPDFDTPEHIKKAAQKALDEGKVHPKSGVINVILNLTGS